MALTTTKTGQQDNVQKSGKDASHKTDEAQLEQAPYNPNIASPSDPEKAWQNHMIAAIHAHYPHARDGVDFSWGRKDPQSDMEMLAWDEKRMGNFDQGKVEEEARKLAKADPYAAYQSKPSLAGSNDPKYGPGEVDNEAQKRQREQPQQDREQQDREREQQQRREERLREEREREEQNQQEPRRGRRGEEEDR